MPFFARVRAIAVNAKTGTDHLPHFVSRGAGSASIGVAEFFDLCGECAAAFNVERQSYFVARVCQSGFTQPAPIDNGISGGNFGVVEFTVLNQQQRFDRQRRNSFVTFEYPLPGTRIIEDRAVFAADHQTAGRRLAERGSDSPAGEAFQFR